jgi:hypothetical protein
VIDARPGLHPQRLASLAESAVTRCSLDLSGAVVVTEGATGAYVVTPVLAALAGAKRVFAVTHSTPYGTVDDVSAQTYEVARRLGVADLIRIVTDLPMELVAQADIVTNSGHVRPINAAVIEHMKPNAVIPLMYEAWEFRDADVDLDACRRKGILVGGTNERHPDVDVFSFLGLMAVKQLLDAGVAPYLSSVLLLCDNAFCPYIERGLVAAGARVHTADSLADAPGDGSFDAIVCAMLPRADAVIDAAAAAEIARRWPGAVFTQYWGDVDREALASAAVPAWPPVAPGRGHMGVLPSAVGPEPIVRLQCGGLKAAEVMWKRLGGPALDYVQPLWDISPV